VDNRDERNAIQAEFQSKTADAAARPEYYLDPERSPYGPGTRAWVAATLASRPHLASTVQKFSMNANVPELPRFPSNLDPIERAYGGFYGVTSIIAPPGVGKTMLAFSTALTAAATQEWNVVYFCGELDEGEMIERRAREMTAHPGSIDGVDFLKVVQVGIGQTIFDFCVELAGMDPDIPILVLMDSINTIAELSRKDYLRTLADFAIWAMMARRLSRGAASFLLVSETNKKGNSKGEKLEFWSDLAVNMSGKKGDAYVDFNISKVRRGSWVPMGLMARHWDTNRFYTKDQLHARRQPLLTAVGDDVEF